MSSNCHQYTIIEAQNMARYLMAWRGQSLLLLGNEGELDGSGISGYYFRGARYLSLLRFQINNHNLKFCSSGRIDFNRLEFFYIYPPVRAGSTGGSGSGMINKQDGISERGLDIRFVYWVRPSGLDISIQITNRWDDFVKFEFQTVAKSDFLSMDEAYRDIKENLPGSEFLKTDTGISFICKYPQVPLKMNLTVPEIASWNVQKNLLTKSYSIQRGEMKEVNIHVRTFDPFYPFYDHQWREREQLMTNWSANLTKLRSDASVQYPFIVNGLMEYLCSAALLEGESDEWLAPAAGYPLYPFLFGRDALTSGWMMAMFDGGQSIDHTLTRLGKLQGTKVDDFRDEQPGRILQQVRNDLSSRTGKNPFDRYYGDYASPFMFIISLAHFYAWDGQIIKIKKHWDSCRRILDWAEKYADIDGDGFLEYKTKSPSGPCHQGWKDSQNAIVDENGSLVAPPIATCELQGYYYAALQAAALFSVFNHAYGDALSYAIKSRDLKKRFNETFWVDDGGYIAFGLDSQKKVIKVKTSNMGHCLASGIIGDDKLRRVVDCLFSSDMFSGWGIRTLSSANPSYNPLSYHLGSIWPVENATIAFGLRRYGFDDEAYRLIEANYDLACLWKSGHIPECIGGYDRSKTGHPGAYPRANSLQTWNAAAFGLFTHVILGLQPVAPIKTLFIDPILPHWLPSLTVEKLQIGGATVSFHCTRKTDGRTRTKILEKRGTVHIVHQRPVNALNSSRLKRIYNLVCGYIKG